MNYRILGPVLPVLSALYGLAVWFNQRLFYWQIRKRRKLPFPVVCVGNITAGGTGKTLAVMAIGRLLLENKKKFVILTRGYCGKSKAVEIVSDGPKVFLSAQQAGDEACLLAKSLSVPVIKGADRYQAGLAAFEKFKPQGAILDDGFQHWPLSRDLNIICIDCLDPYGGGHLLPWGMLREPLTGLRRADLFLLTHSDLVDKEKIESIKKNLRNWNQRAEIVVSCHQPLYFYPHWRREEKIELKDWVSKEVLAFSGVGSPKSFLDTLNRIGLKVTESVSFPDHFNFTEEKLSALKKLSETKNIPLVTTAKDAVRLPGNFPCFVLEVKLEITEGEKVWREKILPLFI
ncbi:MAG: tetraacyldisaccharide 4'-kinase [Elusimicrobiota bacterium]